MKGNMDVKENKERIKKRRRHIKTVSPENRKTGNKQKLRAFNLLMVRLGWLRVGLEPGGRTYTLWPCMRLLGALFP